MSSRILTAAGEWIDDQGPDLLPLASFLGEPDHASVRLAPTDDPAQLKPYLDRLSIIAIEFPKFTDGRGYSIAALLRRDGYRGELRAIGDVLVDQLFFMKRVGFTSFALRADQDRVLALRKLATYSDAYQGAYDQPLPAFRRRASITTTAVAR
jgi:uncharacterized protein (DUF934 family)